MFMSRYEALGMDLPDPTNMCRGPCEGVGFYPQGPSGTPAERIAWDEAHRTAHTVSARIRNAIQFRRLSYLWERCDGCHFITCPDCGGTGLDPASSAN